MQPIFSTFRSCVHHVEFIYLFEVRNNKNLFPHTAPNC
jgi:hypothetical protein